MKETAAAPKKSFSWLAFSNQPENVSAQDLDESTPEATFPLGARCASGDIWPAAALSALAQAPAAAEAWVKAPPRRVPAAFTAWVMVSLIVVDACACCCWKVARAAAEAPLGGVFELSLVSASAAVVSAWDWAAMAARACCCADSSAAAYIRSAPAALVTAASRELRSLA